MPHFRAQQSRLHSVDPAILTAVLSAAEEKLVPLDPDHPGFRDPEYRQRRNHIAQISRSACVGEEVPRVAYTDVENEVWRIVWKNLAPLHDQYACHEFIEGLDIVKINREYIPQLADINRMLTPVSGTQMIPVAGLVSAKTFHQYLAKRLFLSTQYIRHSSTPLYTPEPDIVHEMVGHAPTLAHPILAELNELAGKAAEFLSVEEMLQLERVYWYTLEFGLTYENNKLKAYGAGLLSSFGEMQRMEKMANIQPMIISQVAQTPYDPTIYQQTLFVTPSMDALLNDLTTWLNQLIQMSQNRR